MRQSPAKLGKDTTNLVLDARLALLLSRAAREEAFPARSRSSGGGSMLMNAASSEMHFECFVFVLFMCLVFFL